MLVDRNIRSAPAPVPYLEILGSLEIGQSVFSDDWRRASSLRSLSYYLVKTSKPDWKFTFRKMDRGWRIIRVQ